jgi:hypothetical protein
MHVADYRGTFPGMAREGVRQPAGLRLRTVSRVAALLVLLVVAPGPAILADDPPAECSVPVILPGGVTMYTIATSSANPEPAAPEPATTLPDDATLEANGAVIGEITINNGDIFDPDLPGENNWLFRTANKLHINTRPGVIRSLLLIKPGDPYSAQKIRESERLLRETAYLYDGDIRITRYENNTVDLVVDTHDVWTLGGGFGFRREGGENTARIGIEDSNFFGFGKDVTIQWSTNVDRTTMFYQYRDPNVAGTRVRTSVAYADNSDGSSWKLEAGRPFFSLDTRWATGGVGFSQAGINTLWNLGQVTEEFRREQSFYQVSGGISRGLVGGKVGRWRFGVTYDDNRFAPVEIGADDGSGPAGPDNAFVPPDRRMVYPWFEYERIQDHFVEVHDLNKIHRTEDLHLGQRYRVRLGYASKAIGADRDQFILSGGYGIGGRPGNGQMITLDTHGSGRFGPDGTENVIVGASTRYFLRDFGRHVFFVGLQGDVAYNLDPERQLLLGGDTGLRGYPLRYQAGDRRVILTVEQRFYTSWHLFKLFRVGGAVFADAGAAWFAGQDDPTNLGLLRDVGLGLRLSSSRSAEGSMVHIDLAFPLDGTPDIRRAQVVIRSKDTF